MNGPYEILLLRDGSGDGRVARRTRVEAAALMRWIGGRRTRYLGQAMPCFLASDAPRHDALQAYRDPRHVVVRVGTAGDSAAFARGPGYYALPDVTPREALGHFAAASGAEEEGGPTLKAMKL